MLVSSFESMTCSINKHFVQLYRNTFEYVNEGCLEPSLSCFLDVMQGLAAEITERFHRRVAITTATLTLDDTYTNTETLE